MSLNISLFIYKDDVEYLISLDTKDVELGANYFYWILGSVHEEDALYFGWVMGGPVSGHSIEQILKGTRAGAGRIFPPLPIPWWFAHTGVTVAESWDAEPEPDVYYLKRPWIARHPSHPDLVRYHGYRVRKWRITDALLGRAGKKVDKDRFIAALASALDHLHKVVGLVHNNIHPGNIVVSPNGVPTLIDLGSVYPGGEEMTKGIPFSCWGGDPLDMNPETHFDGPRTASHTSGKSRDLAALKQLGTWLDNPIDPWTTTISRQQADTADYFVEVGNRRRQEAVARRKDNEAAA
ncbi:hypothetical protein B0H67DRAFT_655404 [Lasiosphaeris hirsuta]|uniref:Protein kinase domain-containing protein n=1 Tax=Lasiosphaeris hirsuta TaxID=260670 RepID=A0AA40BDZ0_9PEZI|nr:hypothetical protein B0H67DRAFT_655404 [Lasiosphaeris hirsuta]